MPQKPPGEQLTFRSSFNIFYILCTIHARCVQPFLRTKTGTAARGVFSFIAGILMFYGAFALIDEPLLMYFMLWAIGAMGQMIDAKRCKGIHSQYDGRPWLAMLICRDEGMARLIVEPLICLGAGYGLLQISEVLGKLVMSAGFSLAFLENYYRHITKQREQQVIDARIEAETLNQGVRERFGDYR